MPQRKQAMEQSLSASEPSNLSQSPTLTTIKPTELSDIWLSAKWEACSGFIQDALEHAQNSHTLDDVLRLVLVGDAQFWPAEKAALVTEIIDYPQRRTLRFWLAGGDLETLRDLEKDAIEWSKHWNCVASEIVGRRGWMRALDGYEIAATVGVKHYE
jgi:hypothetical protein